jgi:hypothetical protein
MLPIWNLTVRSAIDNITEISAYVFPALTHLRIWRSRGDRKTFFSADADYTD